jgi:hypothetical protein
VVEQVAADGVAGVGAAPVAVVEGQFEGLGLVIESQGVALLDKDVVFGDEVDGAEQGLGGELAHVTHGDLATAAGTPVEIHIEVPRGCGWGLEFPYLGGCAKGQTE